MTQDAHGQALSELRHRAANIFQLIGALARMRSQRSTDDEARRQLLWIADAVGSLGALERHRRGEAVEMGAFLAEVAPSWRRRHGGAAPLLIVEPSEVRALDSAATSLALIAQELVTNALSHAFPAGGGQVTIRLDRVGPDRCELMVADDGQGFDVDAGLDRFGLWFVRSLAGQLRGEFVLQRRLGTTARLSFPCPEV